jgi:plastocyanin
VDVTIANFAFSPDTLTVKVGTTVKWTNQDSATHNVTAEDNSFKSGDLNQGDSFSFTFTTAGTYAYRCGFHASMKATITVVP